MSAANQYGLKEKLRKKPGYIVYGEIYGPNVQDLGYGIKPEEGLGFRVFDIKDISIEEFLDYDDMCKVAKDMGLVTVPLLWRGKWKECDLKAHTEGTSTISNTTIREGCVVKPSHETYDVIRLGRVILKSINPEYLLRDGGTEFK